ncbi:hypothetical protein ACGFYV_05200 [Streptomyces sp. NPDC048297]|uniref:hypothetical protein n=1 Tax=Streptomyces sp. NPDC048297 TaxID=3365531 RepID=UPI00371423F0
MGENVCELARGTPFLVAGLRLYLEQHGGRTFEGVAVRVAQRVLAPVAAIWHNRKT